LPKAHDVLLSLPAHPDPPAMLDALDPKPAADFLKSGYQLDSRARAQQEREDFASVCRDQSGFPPGESRIGRSRMSGPTGEDRTGGPSCRGERGQEEEPSVRGRPASSTVGAIGRCAWRIASKALEITHRAQDLVTLTLQRG
jgi:hypothetical protein